jgi:hypothetical protein
MLAEVKKIVVGKINEALQVSPFRVLTSMFINATLIFDGHYVENIKL